MSINFKNLQSKKDRSPKNSQDLREAMEDPSKYKELIVGNPKKYNWDEYITFNKMDRNAIVRSSSLSLVQHYFQDQDLYYEDLTNNVEDVSIEIFKFFAERKLQHTLGIQEIRRKYDLDFDYNFILSFIRRPDVLEYIYKSSFLPANFYEHGTDQILNEIIKLQRYDSLVILLKYAINIDLDYSLNFYEFGLNSTFEIYKLVLSKLKDVEPYNQEELEQGLSETIVDRKDKISYRY